jgi:large subunit ribosomal protein L29
MADTRAQELRDSDDEALVTALRESKEELFNLRFQVATGQLDNNRRLQTVRRDIARIYTVMRERELGIDRSTAAVSASQAAAPQTVKASS